MSCTEFIRKYWDRIATYGCFGIFGVVQIVHPIASTTGTPRPVALLFNIELIMASIILMASLFRDSTRLRIIGYTIYLIGMLTISGLILLNSGSSIWILVLGFAFQGAISVRYVSRDRKVAHDLGEVVKELEERQDKNGG